MKKITKFLLLGALTIPYLGTAQVNVSTTPENRNAVIEEWTGIYCTFCPLGHAAVQEAIENNPGDVVGIRERSKSLETISNSLASSNAF